MPLEVVSHLFFPWHRSNPKNRWVARKRLGCAKRATSIFEMHLAEDRLDHVSVNVSQAEIAALVSIGQSRVIETQQM